MRQVKLVLLTIRVLGRHQDLQRNVGDGYALDVNRQRRRGSLLVADFPGTAADIHLDFIGDLDHDVFHQVPRRQFGGGTVFELRQGVDHALAVLLRFLDQDINVFGGPHQAVQDARLRSDHEVGGLVLVEQGANTRQRIYGRR